MIFDWSKESNFLCIIKEEEVRIMRKVRRTRAKKVLIVSVMVAGMVTMGATYAVWNSSLNIDANITTGNMDIRFRDQVREKYQASLVDISGVEKKKVDAEFVMEEDGKKMKVLFKTGLPLTNLIKGELIKIDFPLIPSPESTVNMLQETKDNFDKEGTLVEMKCDKVMVLSGLNLYSTAVLEDDFTQDLKFDLYQTVHPTIEQEEEGMTATVFLKLKEESIQRLQNLPKAITLKQSDLQQTTTLTEEERAKFQQDGVVASYTCELPFYVEQKQFSKSTIKCK